MLLADDLILTKVDVVGARAVGEVRSVIAELHPQARLFFAERDLLDWRPLLEWTPSTVASRLDVMPELCPMAVERLGRSPSLAER